MMLLLVLKIVVRRLRIFVQIHICGIISYRLLLN